MYSRGDLQASTLGLTSVPPTLKEPVEVIALFRDRTIAPLRFKWGKRIVKVAQVKGEWVKTEDTTRSWNFAVSTENGDYFELTFHPANWHYPDSAHRLPTMLDSLPRMAVASSEVFANPEDHPTPSTHNFAESHSVAER